MVNTLDQVRLLVVIRLRLLLLTKCEDRPFTCSSAVGWLLVLDFLIQYRSIVLL